MVLVIDTVAFAAAAAASASASASASADDDDDAAAECGGDQGRVSHQTLWPTSWSHC